MIKKLKKALNKHYIPITIMLLTLVVFQIIQITLASPGIGSVIYEDSQSNGYEINIDKISLGLISSHKQLGYQVGLIDKEDKTILDNVKTMKELNQQSIFELLDKKRNKSKALNNYLIEINKSLVKSESNIDKINQEIDILNSNLINCQSEKNSNKLDYYDGLNSYNQNLANSSLEKSVENNKCVSENQTKITAHKELLARINDQKVILKKRYNLINSKRELIIKHYDVIEANLLNELINIQKSLK